MRNFVTVAVACLAFAFMVLVPSAPAVAASLAHFFVHPAVHSAGLAHAAAILSILAVPAPASMPRSIAGRVRGEAQTDPKKLVEEIQRTFAAFKEANDLRLTQLESHAEDIVTAEQVDRINGSLTTLTKDLERLQAEAAANKLGGGGAPSAEVKAHSSAFHSWFRKGNEPTSMRELEVNAGLTTQSDPDGGFLVPTQMEGTIDRVLGTVSAVRGISRVINVSTSEYKKLVNMAGTGSGWVGEEDGSAIDRIRRPCARSRSASPSCMPILHRRRRRSMIRRSTSSSGSPTRSRSRSPRRKAQPSSPATA
jgi:hypothetical protein